MAEPPRDFKALNLSVREWNLVEDARRKAERKTGTSLTNKELLLALAGQA
jgi:hypothetical protein